MMKQHTKFLTVLGAAAMITLASPAAAQQTQPTAPSQPQNVKISETAMQEFAKVQKQIMEIQKHYRAQAQKVANDQQKIKEISKQANQDMTEVVESSPLSIQQYNQIATALPRDKNLQDRYRKALTQ